MSLVADKSNSISTSVDKLNVICFLFDHRVGGPHVCARSIYHEFIKLGHNARIAVPKGPGNAKSFFATKGVPLDELRIAKPASPKNFINFLRFLLGLPLGIFRTVRYLRSNQPDVIRTNGALDIVPVISGWIAGVPVILYLNDTIFPPRLSRFLVQILRPFTSRIIAAASQVGVHHGMENAEVIFEPVDITRFRPSNKKLDREQPVIGLLANWNPVKCQERFIETIRSLRENGVDATGRILGGFPKSQKDYWKPLLQRIETLGLSEFIDTPGFVDDTAKALAEFDILVLTSSSEACPVCVLEAMASGIPTVSFDVGGVSEMLGVATSQPAGIVVTEGETGQMVIELSKLIQDREKYQKLSGAGPNRAQQLFSLEACVRKHEQVCQEVRKN